MFPYRNVRRDGSILIVEDDPAVAAVLSTALTEHGFAVRHAGTGAEARRQLSQHEPDLVMLDLVLPDADGVMLYLDIAERTAAPVVVCSASRRARERALVLRLGAADFIRKPFELDELLARVAAALRRHAEPWAPNRPAAARQPATTGEPRRSDRLPSLPLGVRWTRSEVLVLGPLQAAHGEPVPHELLARAVWGCHGEGERAGLHTVLHRLRAKLAAADANGGVSWRIQSVRGLGYRLVRLA